MLKGGGIRQCGARNLSRSSTITRLRRAREGGCHAAGWSAADNRYVKRSPSFGQRSKVRGEAKLGGSRAPSRMSYCSFAAICWHRARSARSTYCTMGKRNFARAASYSCCGIWTRTGRAAGFSQRNRFTRSGSGIAVQPAVADGNPSDVQEDTGTGAGRGAGIMRDDHAPFVEIVGPQHLFGAVPSIFATFARSTAGCMRERGSSIPCESAPGGTGPWIQRARFANRGRNCRLIRWPAFAMPPFVSAPSTLAIRCSAIPRRASEGIDDPRSRYYNRLVDRAKVAKNRLATAPNSVAGRQSLQMGRGRAHNSRATPGAGSCIFLHI